MSKPVKIVERPELKNPILIAAWPGMGNVAVVAVNHLKEKLKAKLLGEMPSQDYFAPTGATVSDQVIRTPDKPINQFFYSRVPSGNDIIFFLGNVQPIPHLEYAFAREIIQFAMLFGTSMVITAGAAPSDMGFQDNPRVFAVPNRQELLKRLMEHKVHFMNEGNIAGLNGLLISVAAEEGLKGLCILGEIPFFTAQIEFPRAALRVLEVLSKIIGIPVDLADLERYVVRKEKEFEPIAKLLAKHSPEKDVHESDKFVPEQDKDIPPTVRLKIEQLFQQAEFDGNYKTKMRLKEELDKWGLFEEYQDRFLDLFRKV
ncbi:MAG TPA: PAC2 family protein [bacterium]